MTTCKIIWTPTTKEPKFCHALATTSAFNLKLCHIQHMSWNLILSDHICFVQTFRKYIQIWFTLTSNCVKKYTLICHIWQKYQKIQKVVGLLYVLSNLLDILFKLLDYLSNMHFQTLTKLDGVGPIDNRPTTI